MKLLKKIATRCRSAGLAVACFFTPKSEELTVFSQARGRYNGNSRYLFEYLVDNQYKVFWLYSADCQRAKIPDKFMKNVIKTRSIKGFLVLLRARNFVISHGLSDFGSYKILAKMNHVVNVWHGISIKNIHVLDRKVGRKKIASRLKNEMRYYKAMIASSDIDRYATSAFHRVDARNIYITGLPKTDQYVKCLDKKRSENKSKAATKILYAPTFRDYDDPKMLFFPFSDFDEAQLKSMLEGNEELKFYLRAHPNDTTSAQGAITLERKFPNHIVHYSKDIIDDIDEVLYDFDIIITDYSSIYMEPLLGDTPCIFIPFDYDQYMASRGLAYDYSLITPGPKVQSFGELVAAIAQAKTGAMEWAEKRRLVADIFFKYKDAGACRRIVSELLLAKVQKQKFAV